MAYEEQESGVCGTRVVRRARVALTSVYHLHGIRACSPAKSSCNPPLLAFSFASSGKRETP